MKSPSVKPLGRKPPSTKPPVLSTAQIEAAAEALLAAYARWRGRSVTLPVPIEHLIEAYLGLSLLYEAIPPDGDRLIVSKISQPVGGQPAEITVNAALLGSLLAEHPGLEQTALAHEVGHHQLHLASRRRLPLALDRGPARTYHLPAAALPGSAAAVERHRASRFDDAWWTEWQAHTFARFLLMPRGLLAPRLANLDLCHWPTLYRLRDLCGVTISALRVHLEKLGYLRLTADGRLVPGPAIPGSHRVTPPRLAPT